MGEDFSDAGEVLKGDEAGERADEGAGTADVYADEQRLPCAGEVGEQHGGGHVADGLAEARADEESVVGHERAQPIIQCGNAGEVAGEGEEAHEGEQQRAVDGGESSTVGRGQDGNDGERHC